MEKLKKPRRKSNVELCECYVIEPISQIYPTGSYNGGSSGGSGSGGSGSGNGGSGGSSAPSCGRNGNGFDGLVAIPSRKIFFA